MIDASLLKVVKVYQLNETLIHEMVHIYCAVKKIKDINLDYGYHTIEYKKVCDIIGLHCENINDGRGYAETKLSSKLVDHVTKIINKTNICDELKHL